MIVFTLGQNLDHVKEREVSQRMCLIIHLPNTFWFPWCTWQSAAQSNSPLRDTSLVLLLLLPLLPTTTHWFVPPSLMAELPLAGAAGGMETYGKRYTAYKILTIAGGELHDLKRRLRLSCSRKFSCGGLVASWFRFLCFCCTIFKPLWCWIRNGLQNCVGRE